MRSLAFVAAVAACEKYTAVPAGGSGTLHQTHSTAKLNNDEIKVAVDQHNDIRVNVSPEAQNMLVMEWDQELAGMAEYWAKQCRFTHSPYNGHRNGAGENLFISGATTFTAGMLEQAIKSWGSEVADYTFDGNKCDAGKACGHYTQQVHHDSDRVGCGQAVCSDVAGTIIVCNYRQAGNIPNRGPYDQGNSCSKCPFGSACATETAFKDKLCKWDIDLSSDRAANGCDGEAQDNNVTNGEDDGSDGRCASKSDKLVTVNIPDYDKEVTIDAIVKAPTAVGNQMSLVRAVGGGAMTFTVDAANNKYTMLRAGSGAIAGLLEYLQFKGGDLVRVTLTCKDNTCMHYINGIYVLDQLVAQIGNPSYKNEFNSKWTFEAGTEVKDIVAFSRFLSAGEVWNLPKNSSSDSTSSSTTSSSTTSKENDSAAAVTASVALLSLAGSQF